MSKYEDIKNKVRKNWENSQTNESSIKIVKFTEDLKEKDITKLRLTNSIFSRVLDLSTDFEPMLPGWLSNVDNSFDTKIKNWSVIIQMREECIPLTRFEVEYKSPSNPFSGAEVNYQNFIQVNDISDNLKEVTWYIGWLIQQEGEAIPADLELRLLLTIPNPNTYV